MQSLQTQRYTFYTKSLLRQADTQNHKVFVALLSLTTSTAGVFSVENHPVTHHNLAKTYKLFFRRPIRYKISKASQSFLLFRTSKRWFLPGLVKSKTHKLMNSYMAKRRRHICRCLQCRAMFFFFDIFLTGFWQLSVRFWSIHIHMAYTWCTFDRVLYPSNLSFCLQWPT